MSVEYNDIKYVINTLGYNNKVTNIELCSENHCQKGKLYIGKPLDDHFSEVYFYENDMFNTEEERLTESERRFEQFLHDFSDKVSTKEGFVKTLINAYQTSCEDGVSSQEIAILMGYAVKHFGTEFKEEFTCGNYTNELLETSKKYVK